MDSRALLLCFAVGAAALGALSTSGCSGPNPAALKLEERDPDNPAPAPTSTGTGNNNNNPGMDGGTTPGGGESDSVFGTSTFAYVAPTQNANAVPDHDGAVSGKDCITSGCHLDNQHKWVFAGTVYSAPTGGTPVAQAEVRMVNPDGTVFGSAYTDANGNFWFDKAGAAIPAGAKVGVRKATGSPLKMATGFTPTDKSCNANRANCHGTGTGAVYIP